MYFDGPTLNPWNKRNPPTLFIVNWSTCRRSRFHTLRRAAKMRYIHSQESLEVPDNGKLYSCIYRHLRLEGVEDLPVN